MSHSIVVPSLELLLIAGRAVALLAAFALFAWGFIRWRRAAQRDTQRVFEQLDLVRADLLIMKELTQGAAQRVDSAAQRVANDARVTPNQSTHAGRSYEIAARLARNGARKEELIKNCGITAHEAELLVKLHGGVNNSISVAEQKVAASIAEVGRQVRKPAPAAQPQQQARPQQRSRLVAVG
jgi:hypothetical protein